jgi:hypothetical protein
MLVYFCLLFYFTNNESSAPIIFSPCFAFMLLVTSLFFSFSFSFHRSWRHMNIFITQKNPINFFLSDQIIDIKHSGLFYIECQCSCKILNLGIIILLLKIYFLIYHKMQNSAWTHTWLLALKMNHSLIFEDKSNEWMIIWAILPLIDPLFLKIHGILNSYEDN